MKVAIIGAGISGLSCAITLERHGIYPDIFERFSKTGSAYTHVSALLQIVDRPIKDSLNYINDKYDINIEPLEKIRKAIHYGPSTRATITGELGYLIYRGQEKHSIINQLAQKVKSNIHFDTNADYKQLKKDYDYVVAATGRHMEPVELGTWQDILPTWVKGATVLGDFNPDTVQFWINNSYFNNGYAYLTPFSDKKASLILIGTEISENRIDKYWDYFISGENLNYKFIEYFKIKKHSGYVYPHKVDNVYLVGNAGGAIGPFLGFGQLDSIISGCEAGKSIALGLDYETQLDFVVKRYKENLNFRKWFNSLNNNNLDKLINSLNLPGVNSFIYNTNINFPKISSIGLKAYDYIFGYKK